MVTDLSVIPYVTDLLSARACYTQARNILKVEIITTEMITTEIITTEIITTLYPRTYVITRSVVA